MNTTTQHADFTMPPPSFYSLIKVGSQYAVAQRTAMGYIQPVYYSTKREAVAALAALKGAK